MASDREAEARALIEDRSKLWAEQNPEHTIEDVLMASYLRAPRDDDPRILAILADWGVLDVYSTLCYIDAAGYEIVKKGESHESRA